MLDFHVSWTGIAKDQLETIRRRHRGLGDVRRDVLVKITGTVPNYDALVNHDPVLGRPCAKLRLTSAVKPLVVHCNVTPHAPARNGRRKLWVSAIHVSS